MMIKGINHKNSLIIVALERELPQKLLPNWNIVYSGVGKVNAALTVAKAYNTYKPSTIINYGTAGALNSNLKGLVSINSFKQRDMDVTALGFKVGETPFEKNKTIKFNYDGFSCGTGDNFVISKQTLKTDVVDMEAYSIAKFCHLNRINFYCYKYISDNANNEAANDWEENIQNGAMDFIKTLESNLK